MKRITSAIAVVVLVIAGSASARDRPTTIRAFFEAGARTRVIAHRGFSARAPENTLAAIREAIVIGADMVEIDVTLSSDGHVVVIHDETLDRTSSGSGPISDRSLEELKALDAGSWFDPGFAGEPIPTLDEVLAEVNGRILLNIEIKSEAVERGIAAQVIEAVRRSAMRDQVVISSFAPAALEQVHTRAPEIVTAVLYNSKIHDGLDAIDIVMSVRATAFNIKRQRLTPAMLKRCGEYGVPIGIYTINKKRHMRRMIKKGVAAIFTDHPDRLIEVLQNHAAPEPSLETVTASP